MKPKTNSKKYSFDAMPENLQLAQTNNNLLPAKTEQSGGEKNASSIHGNSQTTNEENCVKQNVDKTENSLAVARDANDSEIHIKPNDQASENTGSIDGNNNNCVTRSHNDQKSENIENGTLIGTNFHGSNNDLENNTQNNHVTTNNGITGISGTVENPTFHNVNQTNEHSKNIYAQTVTVNEFPKELEALLVKLLLKLEI